MNLRIQLPCWVSLGLLFSACATLETGGPDFALTKCPVSPAQASTAQAHIRTIFNCRCVRSSSCAAKPVRCGEDPAAK